MVSRDVSGLFKEGQPIEDVHAAMQHATCAGRCSKITLWRRRNTDFPNVAAGLVQASFAAFQP